MHLLELVITLEPHHYSNLCVATKLVMGCRTQKNGKHRVWSWHHSLFLKTMAKLKR